MERTSTFGVILAFILFLHNCSRDHEVTAEFYQGCSNSTSSCKGYELAAESHLPFSCVKKCIKESFSFAAIQNGSTCFCCHAVDSWTKQSNCASRCTLSSSSISNLTCGGIGFSSVYTTALPVIYAVSMDVPSKAIAIKTKLAMEVTILAHRKANESKDLQSIQGLNQTLSNVYLTWKVNNSPWNYSEHALDGNSTKISKVDVFDKPGEYRLCITAENLVSEASGCILLDVLIPVSGAYIVDVDPERKVFRDGRNITVIELRKDLTLKVALNKSSKVDFRVSFGDGSTDVVISSKAEDHYTGGLACMTTWHKYRQCGSYNVTVDISNAISTVSLPVIPVNVQRPVTSASLPLVGALPGKLFKVKVRVNHDYDEENMCNFRFNWTFNKWKTVNTTTVPYIENKFHELKTHNYSVKVFNDLSSTLQASGHVYIQTRLSNVTLSIDGISSTSKYTYKKLRTSVKVHATVVPSFDYVLYYWYSNGKKIRQGNQASLEHEFSKTGSYSVQVVAKSLIDSNVSSNTQVVIIEEPIHEVKLKHKGVIVLKQSIAFSVEINGGSNVKILWDFGDGNSVKSTRWKITHIYKKKGNFKVKVMAYNNVSHANDSRPVSVTRYPSCQPPDVKIIGWKSFKIYRFDEVNIESQVTIDCRWQNLSLVYEWKIIPSEELQATQNVVSGIELSEAVLIIPPYTLNHGKYDVTLKVHKNNTVLSDEEKIEIHVVRHSLISSIKGGTIRVVGYKNEELIILDGSESRDPDFPNENKKLRFKWTCSLLNDDMVSCFDPQMSKADLSKAVVKLSTNSLLKGKDAILVTLTVSKVGMMKNQTTWQILRLVDEKPHLLAVNCPQCNKEIVNYNDKLTLYGKCTTCSWNNSINPTLEWRLYAISDSVDLQPGGCASHVEKLHQDALHRAIITSTPRTLRQFFRFAAFKQPTRKPHVTWSLRGRSTGRSRPLGTRGTIYPQPWGTPPTTRPFGTRAKIESGDTCMSKLEIPSNCIRQFGKNPYWLCVTGKPPASYTPRPGTPPRGPVNTGSGVTGSGEVTLQTLKTTQKPLTSKPVRTTPKTIQQTETLYDPLYVVPAATQRHRLLSIKRHLMDMTHSWTNTGLSSLNFVLNKLKLRGGKTYMLALIAKQTFTSSQQREGMANVFFKVNDVPTVGKFGVEPSSGYEIETEFRLMSEDSSYKRLTYHVAYKIPGKENREFPLYTGSNLKPSFILPAGLREKDYSVTLHISAYDSKGSTFEACPIFLKVNTTVLDAHVSSEEYILNKTRGTYIQNLIKVSREQQVKQFVTVLAEALNRLNPVKTTSSKFHLRKEARSEMLNVVHKFRIRDKISAVQTAGVLEALSRVHTELSIDELEIISQLISEAERQIVKQVSWKSTGLSTSLINLICKVISNILESSQPFQRSSPIKHKKIQLQSLKVIQNVIKNKLKNSVSGEKSSKFTNPSFSVITDQSQFVRQHIWTLQGVTFLLPAVQVNKMLGLESHAFSTACVGTAMIVYEENPYAWKRKHNQLYETKASSLVLSSCNGEPREVIDLEQDIEISLPWVMKKENSFQYTVKWQHLNIHLIHLDNSTNNHSLKLQVEILSKLDRGLKLKVFFSKDNDIQNANIFKASSDGSLDFHFTARDLVNSSGAVRVGIVMFDADQNRIKKIFSATPVNYSFSTKWIGCYYWDDKEEIMSTHGCVSTINTSDTFIKCRCNHLTTFVGKAFWSPNQLTIKDLRNIQSISRNPVCLALVSSLVGVYFLLLIYCRKLDMENDVKRDAIFLANALCSHSSHRYKITVETGHWFGSGTSSSVVLRMVGKSNSSNPIELKSKDKPLFRRGSKDVFIFDSSSDLSPLKKIHVWHYNDGDYPSWYLDRIIIQDLLTKEKWFFESYRWLAVDKEDGKVDMELFPLTERKNVSKFQHHYHKGCRYLLDYHLWLSVFGRPSCSSFNHKQRLTCCLSLVMTFLCANAAWFHVTSCGTKVYEILGILDLSWNTVLYGILCGLVALPVNLLWILMFRYAKPHESSTNKVEPAPYEAEMLTETTGLVNNADYDDDTMSILDQTIETLLYLKTLGRKIKPFPSYWYDRSSIDSVFPNLEDESYCSAQAACSTKSPPSPLQHAAASSANSIKPSQEPKEIFSLPHYFVYVAWAGCFVTIVATGFITVWYGLRFGHQKSILWLQSLCFSMLESVFISQPFMIFIIPVYCMCSNWIKRSKTRVAPLNDDSQDKACESIPSGKSSKTYTSLKNALDARRHQRYLKFLKPLNKVSLNDASEKQRIKNAVCNYIRDAISSFVCLVLLCVVVNSMYCRASLKIASSVQSTIIKHSNSEAGHDRPHLWWKANHEQIVNVLYWRPDEWSLRKNISTQIFFKDTLSILIGKPRIRKYTTQKHEVCNRYDMNGTDIKQSCWSRCLIDTGRWSSVELSRTRSIAKEEVQELNARKWVSTCTEEISIDFVLYSASQDVYSVISWKVRSPAFSHPFIQVQVKSIKDTTRNVAMDVFLRICKGIFVATFLFCLYGELVCCVRSKSNYFNSVWKCIEFFWLLLSSMSIVAYICWSVSVYSLLREILKEGGDDVFTVVSLVYHRQELLIALYGLIVFLLILKIIHLCKVFKFVQRFCYLLWATSDLMTGLMVSVIISITAISHFGYLLFGRSYSSFKTFSDSFVHTFGILRLKSRTELRGDECLVIICYFTSVFLLVLVLRGLSIAMYNWSVRSRKRKDFQTHLLIDIIMKKLPRVLRRDKDIEEDSEDEWSEYDEELEDKQIIPVEYACDEVEIQMGELLFKMENLISESKLADNCLSSSSDLLLSSEYDDYEVEYLYRQGLEIDQASGYDSDQSFDSYGQWQWSPESQEGLTDLEVQRRISNGSSNITSADCTPAFTFVVPTETKVIIDNGEVKLPDFSSLRESRDFQQFKEGAPRGAKEVYKNPNSSLTSNSDELHDPRPVTTREIPNPPLGNSRSEIKAKCQPLTRKPKFRRGQISLDDVPKDISLIYNSFSTGPGECTSSEEDRSCSQRNNKSRKYPGKFRQHSRASVLPVDDRYDKPLLKNDAFDSSADYRHSLNNSCQAIENQQHFHGSDGPPSAPYEPGFNNSNTLYADDPDVESHLSDDEMPPLPGLIDDIPINTRTTTNINVASSKKV